MNHPNYLELVAKEKIQGITSEGLTSQALKRVRAEASEPAHKEANRGIWQVIRKFFSLLNGKQLPTVEDNRATQLSRFAGK